MKRQHSFEQSNVSPDPLDPSDQLNVGTSSAIDTTPLLPSTAFNAFLDVGPPDTSIIGSPLKKQRASMGGEEDSIRSARAEALAQGLGFGFSLDASGVGSSTVSPTNKMTFGPPLESVKKEEEAPTLLPPISMSSTEPKAAESVDEEL